MTTNGTRVVKRSARALQARNATVTTATVTIKTLTIDKRQVTLGTFRQVPERDIFDADANLRGVPWGWVNYCPGRGACWAARTTEHDHLLWQDGEVLYRCPVFAPIDWGHWSSYGDYLPRDPFSAAVRDRYMVQFKVLMDLDQLYIAT